MNEPLDPPADYSPSGPEQETIDLSAQLADPYREVR